MRLITQLFKTMTKEEFIEMKDGYIEFVTKMIIDTGSLGPSITILGTHLVDGKNAIVHVPIPPKYMKSGETKDEFVDEVLPDIAKKVSEKFTVLAVAWAAEAYMRIVDKDDRKTEAENIVDWEKLPIKKEVLISTMDSKDHNDTYIMEIVRKGKVVNSEGELTDHIELVKIPELESDDVIVGDGRFAKLYQKFVEKS